MAKPLILYNKNIENKNILFLNCFQLFIIIIISMGALFENIGSIPYYFVLYFLEFLYFILYIIENWNSNKIITKEFTHFLFPFLFCFIYSIIPILLNGFTFAYFSRGVSTLLWLTFSFFYGFIVAKKIGRKAIYIAFYACIFLNIIILLNSIYSYGISTIIEAFESLDFENNQIIKSLEKHQLTFSFGIFFTYFLINKGEKKRVRNLIISLFFLILGFKRIIFIAMIPVILFSILHYVDKTNKNVNKNCKIFTFFSMLIAFFFIFSIKSGLLEQILNIYSINSMGRIKMFNQMSSTYSFNVFFMGNGYGFTSKYYELTFSTLKQQAAAIHSDILALFIDVGFIGFLVFCITFLYGNCKYYLKKKEYSHAIIVFALSLFLFFTYFTDNTLNYSGLNIIFAIVVFSNNKNYKEVKYD